LKKKSNTPVTSASTPGSQYTSLMGGIRVWNVKRYEETYHNGINGHSIYRYHDTFSIGIINDMEVDILGERLILQTYDSVNNLLIFGPLYFNYGNNSIANSTYYQILVDDVVNYSYSTP
jgi:hypothetical protein